MVFRVARGATGFASSESERSSVDIRLFRTGCYAASRAADGAVEHFVEREYPGSFHSAVIATPAVRLRVLCHATHPWVAFTEDGTSSWADPGVFVDPPPWTEVFADLGFALLRRKLLTMPLSETDTSELAKAEWRQIRFWRPPNVGRTLFNGWD
jgi:hypothetical protein